MSYNRPSRSAPVTSCRILSYMSGSDFKYPWYIGMTMCDCDDVSVPLTMRTSCRRISVIFFSLSSDWGSMPYRFIPNSLTVPRCSLAISDLLKVMFSPKSVEGSSETNNYNVETSNYNRQKSNKHKIIAEAPAEELRKDQ